MALLVCQVPGELMIYAQAGSHSFDVSRMNMTHYVGLFSFGRKLSWRAVGWVNELLPELDMNVDRLTGNVFVYEHEFDIRFFLLLGTLLRIVLNLYRL